MPAPYRWMVFVDGENFTLQAQKLAKAKGISFFPGEYWEKDVFLWVGGCTAEPVFRPVREPSVHIPYQLDSRSMRAYYYTSVQGDDSRLLEVRRRLRALLFEPVVFKKTKGKSKGVDIALARDVLCHAFRNNYDVAILVAGDRDYVPLVEELKRLGRIVCVCFFDEPNGGLSDELKLTADFFSRMDGCVFEGWQEYLRRKAQKEQNA